MPDPPAPCQDPTCNSFGVLGPAVATIASIQATEAIKILSGSPDKTSPYLTKFDFWTNSLQRLDISKSRLGNCPCCQMGCYEFLEDTD